MASFIRKTQVAAALLSITSIGAVYADDTATSLTAEDQSCCTQCCGDFFLSAELIYWRATECGLDTCAGGRQSDQIRSNGSVFSRFNGQDQSMRFRWSPGFRIGGGYAFGCSDWDIAAYWTRFHSHAHETNDYRWRIHFDSVDVIAGYDAEVTSCFDLEPFFGARAVRIKQMFDGSTSSFVEHERFSSDRDDEEKFRGGGPLVGLGADLGIGCGWSFFTSASGSWLYGRFNLERNQSAEFFNAVDSSSRWQHLDSSLVVADLALGVRWETRLCNDDRIWLQAGLEDHRYFDYNRFCGCSDLNFDGFNFGIGFEF